MPLQSLPALLGRNGRAQPELPAPHVSPCHVSPPRWGQASLLLSLAARGGRGEPLVIGMQPALQGEPLPRAQQIKSSSERCKRGDEMR